MALSDQQEGGKRDTKIGSGREEEGKKSEDGNFL